MLEIIPFHSCSVLFSLTCIFKFLFPSIEGSEGQKEKKSATKAKSSALKFDYLNVPEKVQWVLTDSSQGSWAPYIGEEKLPESTMQEWAAAFTAATFKHYSKRKV